jgi:hypothetical protein
VLVHGAALFGWSGTHPSHPADEEPRARLIWLETAGSLPAVIGEQPASPGPAASGPSVAANVAPRRHHAASRHAPTSHEATRETEEASFAAAPSAALPGGTPEGVGAPTGASGAGTGLGSAEGRAGSGGGAGDDAGAGAGAPAQGPRLLAAGNPCAGYFPAGAHVAHGRVQVEVEVGANGRIAATRVMAEQPLGEGFAGAARACAADRLQFTPARSSQGTPVEGHARLLLSFDRS